VAGRNGLAFVGQTSFSATTRWQSAEGGQVFPVVGLRKLG
jgi:hypothetical protein